MMLPLPHWWTVANAFIFALCFHIFVFSFVSGERNLTVVNVLECEPSSLSGPPDLSSLWTTNITETCLYVTIEDQFGDGWEDNTKLFYWAQVGAEDSNIVSVGLDCSLEGASCGSLKSGCISPLDLTDMEEGGDEHFFHFTLVSVNEANQLSLPEYHWEIQWSIQVVKGDDWREKYYGGFNSSMVFNYQREADDFTLSWAENLWQYPPVYADCPQLTSAAQFSLLTVGDHPPNHQSYSYGFTPHDSYFGTAYYSVVKLPERSLQQWGLLTCLEGDDLVSNLYPNSFALRASANTTHNDSAWSLCGFSGLGQEELGFAVARGGSCSGQYLGSAGGICSDPGALTSFPSNPPTAAPTISEASAFFSSFDSATLLEEAPAFHSDSTANRAIFSYHINAVADFSTAEEAWGKFISESLVTSFDVEFSAFTVWASYLKLGSSTPVQWSQSCASRKLSDTVFSTISAEASVGDEGTSVACDHINYMSDSGKFCLGCGSSSTFAAQCTGVENELVSVPTRADCYNSSDDSSGLLSKHAVVVEVFLREAVKVSVPTLHHFTLAAHRETFTLLANISSTSSGGKLYCLAALSTQASSTLTTRAAIKSGGVAVSIPPTASTEASLSQSILLELTLTNLHASTEYQVYCFTEDASGSQMSEEDIAPLGQVAATLCCQTLVFDDAPVTVVFGGVGASAVPSVFYFSLPTLPVGSLTVTPTFYSQETGSFVTTVTATKASFLFDTSTSQLGTSRSFVVTPSEPGGFYVRLELSGDTEEVNKYSSAESSFQAQEVGGVLSAPSLSSAQLSDAGGGVTVAFSGSTDQALGAVSYDPSGLWDCELIFSFVGSNNTACSWQSDTTVLLSFCGAGTCSGVTDRKKLALLLPGDNVTLLPGLLRARCEATDPASASCFLNNATNISLNVTVSPPLNPLVPSVFVTTSNPGGDCNSDLILDATSSSGAGGRSWDSFEWTVLVDSAGEEEGGESTNITSEMRQSAVLIQSALNAEGDLSYPLHVPYSLLSEQPVRYSVSLRVTNFLQGSSFSTSLVDMLPTYSVSMGDKPSVSIDGSTYRRIRSFEPLEVSVSVQVPSCSSGNNTQYQWAVYRDITFQSHITSLSADPKVMKLDPYSLTAGFSYRLQVTVTLESGASDVAVFYVDVLEGSVYVKINGASELTLPLDSAWTLDASDSVIEDTPLSDASSRPLLSWSCFVASANTPGTSYGDDCGSVFAVSVSSPLSAAVLVPLRTETMLPGGLYRVTASAYSASGAYESATVDIHMGTVSAEQVPSVTLSSSFRKFNPDRILQLLGSVIAPTAPRDVAANITMSWGVYDSYGAVMDLGSDLAAVLSTPVLKRASVGAVARSANRTVPFSLSAAPGVFVPGTEYSFRLSAEVEVDGGRVASFASATLVANSPPSGGTLEVLPRNGSSMDTFFKWNTLYWTDDLLDLPLRYSFRYLLQQETQGGTLSPSLVGLASQKSYMSSMLPAGRATAGHVVLCSVSVADFYEASAEADTEVVVLEGGTGEGSVDISFSNFSISITSAVQRKDWSAVAQDVSNAAALISLSDCQHAPDCQSFFRYGCSSTTPPHTCGACHLGHNGLAGPSNAPCVLTDTPALEGEAEVGAACDADSDCRYDSCVDRRCSYPQKTCPSSSEQECSGSGVCQFYNSANNQPLVSSAGTPLPCLSNDSSCSSRCLCAPQSYGKACTLSEQQYSNRSLTRELICESLQHLLDNQDPSSELAALMASSAAASFDPSEVITPAAISKCLGVLTGLSSISEGGYFRNEALLSANTSAAEQVATIVSVQEEFAVLVSSFVDTLAWLNSSNSIEFDEGGEWEGLMQEVEDGVDVAVTALGRAISSRMVAGESSLEVVTAGVRMTVSYRPFSSLEGALLAPPLTLEEKQYDSPVSSIVLPATGLSSCLGSAGSDQDQDQDQYARLSVMQWGTNPFSALNTSSTSTNATADQVLSRFLRFTPMQSSSDVSSTFDPPQTDPYTLVLQYASEQNWSRARPSCGLFQGGEAATCPCNVTKYDAFSVTLECYNLVDFCPPSALASEPSARRLNSFMERDTLHGGDTRHPHFRRGAAADERLLKRHHQRRLDFDYGGDADDDTAPSGSLMQYGAVFTNLAGEVTSTLSANPAQITNLKAASPVLFMMGMLMAISAAGYVMCARWDRYDRLYLKYVMQTTPQKKYKAPKVINFKSAFMQKTFVSQKQSSMLRFEDLGSKCRGGKTRVQGITGGADNNTDVFFEDIYEPCHDEYMSDEEKYESIPTLASIKGHVQDHQSSQHTEESAQLDKLGHKIATFFDAALPPASLLAKTNGWTRFIRAALREHDWCRVFSYSSLRLPRTIRFLIVFTDLLILMFVDSVFYGVLFPDDGTCAAWEGTSMEECELEPSKFTSGASLCAWDDEDLLCEIRPPPTSLEFYMIVAIVVTTFSVGPQAICHLVLEEVCCLTPVWGESWGWDFLGWWGGERTTQYSKREPKHTNGSNSDVDSDSSSEGTVELTPDVLDEKWAVAKDAYLFQDGLDTKKLHERYAYYDFTTVEEEAGMLLDFVTSSLEKRLKCAPIPWRQDKHMTGTGLSAANLEAIMTQLGIHADGSPVRLSWSKRVLCCTSPRARVVNKIRKVRSGVDRILEEIGGFSEDLQEYQETALIQHFILEQLTPFKRYALKRQFFQFDCATPENISGTKYVLGWGFMSAVWLFCIYWIFLWALSNGGATMSAWSYEIGFVLMQDVMVNDVVQVILVHVIAIEALRPQLKRIYAVLNQILKEKISTRPTAAAAAAAASAHTMTTAERDAAEKTQQRKLEEGWEFCVAQHLSASCRAARRPELHFLPFSQLLMRITDHDVSLCRDEKGIQLSGLVVALLAVPTVLALSHETVQDMFLDVILPTAWSCFCIANVYALILGPWALIVPYTVLVMVLLYRQLVIVPRIRKRNQERAKLGTGYQYTKDELAWQNMNRQLQLVHMNTLNVSALNPLGVEGSNVVGAAAAFSRDSASKGQAKLRGGGTCGDSVASELTAPESVSVGERSKPEEEEGEEEGGMAELLLPAEIRQMHNFRAREKFMEQRHNSRDVSLLGMSSVNKWLGLARPQKGKGGFGGLSAVVGTDMSEKKKASKYDEISIGEQSASTSSSSDKPSGRLMDSSREDSSKYLEVDMEEGI